MSRERPTIDDEDVQRASAAVLTELSLRELRADIAYLALCRASATLIGMTICPHCIGEALGGMTGLILRKALEVNRYEFERGKFGDCSDQHPEA